MPETLMVPITMAVHNYSTWLGFVCGPGMACVCCNILFDFIVNFNMLFATQNQINKSKSKCKSDNPQKTQYVATSWKIPIIKNGSEPSFSRIISCF